MKPYHRKSILHDICELAPVMRYEDVREVRDVSGHTPEQALLIGYLTGSHCRSIIDRYGGVVGMYGTVPVNKTSASVWMLGSKGLLKIARPFLKKDRSEVEEMNRVYPHLFNVIDSRNEVHLRWIRWCGFKILGERMINNVKFYEFARIASVNS